MNTKEIKHLVNELFNGEYSDILKPLSVGNTFLAKSTLDSYIREFSGKRKLNAIELFTSENSKLHYEDDGSVIKVIKNLIDNKDISGIDNIEFIIAPNKQSIYQPLRKIASGGEISRIMLSLKNVLSLGDYCETCVFDEIDVGVGGRIAEVIGEKIAALSKRKQVFDELMMSVAFFYGIVSVCILCLVQDFIALWIGESYLLQYSTVVVVVFNFYITGMRMPCQVFNTTLGLFWNDRYKPWVEASINLLASILLIKTFGLTGVFLGTLVSTVSTSLWVEPYILYKHGFKMQLLGYFRSYCVYVVEMLVTLFVCYEVGKLISSTNWGVWLIKAVVIFLISTGIFVLMSFKQPAFLGIKKRFMGLVGQVRKER